jgi:feruloyl esterase
MHRDLAICSTLSTAGCGTVLFGVGLLALTLCAGNASANSRSAGSDVVTSNCSATTLTLSGLTIDSVAIIDNGTPTERCHVEGSVATSGEGAPPGSAGFVLDLPTKWNGKLLFDGGGGLNGYLPAPTPEHLAQGYAALGTDGGHRSPNPIYHYEWMQLPSGEMNEAAIADYLYRAIPQVTLAVRPLISRYYQAALRRVYFMGCSNGGRESLFQAQHSPDSFDGFVAGSPSTVPALGLPEVWKLKALRDAPIPYAKLAAVGAAITAACDAVDGVKDGLVQNPAACTFDPKSLVQTGLLTTAQGIALTTYLSAIRDDSGELVEPGAALTGIELIVHYPGIPGSVTGLASYETDLPPHRSLVAGSTAHRPASIQQLAAVGLIAALIYNEPGLDLYGPRLFDADGRLRHEAVEKTKSRWKPGLAVANGFGPTFAKDRKILIYHGLSDHDTAPYETQMFYAAAAKANGGLERTMPNMRLFLAPGMEHCQGGPGPNTFDALAALDTWVESGRPPQSITATKYIDDNPTKPAIRSMPLCPFPAIAHYDGKDSVKHAKSWTCGEDDHTLLQIGPAGHLAGLPDFPP